MQQSKSLTELARKVINLHVPTMQQLRDLTLPPSLIRQLEETFLEHHLQKLWYGESCTKRKTRHHGLYHDILNGFIHYLKGPYYTIPSNLIALQEYTGEDSPDGFSERTVINTWFSVTYKNRLLKMCFACGITHYIKMGKPKIILYGKKSIHKNHDLLVCVKNLDNWCHLCFTTSLFWLDDYIHKDNINQQMEFTMERREETHSYEFDCRSMIKYNRWLLG